MFHSSRISPITKNEASKKLLHSAVRFKSEINTSSLVKPNNTSYSSNSKGAWNEKVSNCFFTLNSDGT